MEIAPSGSPTSNHTTSSTLDLAIPAGVVAGDVLIFTTQTTGDTGAASGTTALVSATNSGVFYRVCDGTESASYSFPTPSGSASGTCRAYSGVSNSSPFNVTGSWNTSTSPATALSVTTTVDGCMLVVAIGHGGGRTFSTPTGFGNAVSDNTSRTAFSADKLQTAAGATGDVKSAYAGSGSAVAVVFALAPAASGGTTLSPTGIASGETFGAATVRFVAAPQGAASTEAFGAGRVFRLLGPAGVSSSETWNPPRVVRPLGPVGITSRETLSLPHVLRLLFPLGVVSGEALGRPAIVGGIQGPYTVSGAGAITSLEAFGQADRLIRVLAASPILSAEAFGTTKIIRTLARAGAISSSESFGVAHVYRVLGPTGIVSQVAVGQNGRLVRYLGAIGAAASETWGRPIVIGGIQPVVSPGGGGDALLTDIAVYAVLAADGNVYWVDLSDIDAYTGSVADRLGG